MKSTHSSLNWLMRSLAALGLMVLPAVLSATSAHADSSRSLVLNAGETQVIDNLNPATPADLKVIVNPHALIVHSDVPGKLVLVGAEEGKWQIAAKLSDGEAVTYDVTVHADKDWSKPLSPGEAPKAMSDGSSSAAAAPAASAASMDPGSGPVAAEKPAVTMVASSSPSAMGSSATSAPAPAAASNFAAAPSVPSQTASEQMQAGGVFKSDPSIVSSGQTYSTDGVTSSGGSHFLPADGISMMTGMSQVIDFSQRLHRVSIADTEIADVQVVNPYQLNLIGHKPGFTTLAVWTGQGHYEERQVRIDPSGKQQVMLDCVVAELNRGRMENQGINVAGALSNTGLSLVGLPGAVATPFSPQTQVTSQTPLGPISSSQSAVMPPGGSLLPLLLSQNLTYGLATQNGQVATQTFFQVLENHNLAKILAQPNLLANSGEKAKFLSGGEIPIVIAQALNTSIVFKEFGTKMTFLPTVVGVNEVELLVQPEVSEPDYAHGVQMFGFNIPAFITRRAETLVRLRDNQTLIIAGLILHQKREVIQKVPYLGDIPYAGGLFRNTSYNNTESDLVMSVTPQIVRPLPAGGRVYLPSSSGQLTSSEIRTERLKEPDVGRPRF
jgi:Flp pilus assembly secretin CpaC